MIDPLSQVISLLQPSATLSKLVTASGLWAVPAPKGAGPFYVVVIEGVCELSVIGRLPVRLSQGDFALIPTENDFTLTSSAPPPFGCVTEPVKVSPGIFHLGEPGAPDVRMLIGHYTFGSDDKALLVSLLPERVIVRGERRLTVLVELLSEEARANRPGRDVVLTHLIELLLIEAFRATSESTETPGLLRGLASERLAPALRCMHNDPAHPWSINELAKVSALSRSTFFERFRRETGVRPMEYLLRWRMSLAKNLLRSSDMSVSQVAQHTGYSSYSTFSVAFTRQVGVSPTTYARQNRKRLSNSDSQPKSEP